MINQSSLESVKQSSDIISVIGNYVKLKKDGANYKGLCPFHAEKSPSFTVSPSKQIYKCFGCGKSGDVISFIQDHESKSYIEAIRILAGKANIVLDEYNSKKNYCIPAARLQKLTDQTISYFENHRKISNNTLLRFKVTDSVEWMPKAKAEIPVILFNYYRDGNLVNIKFRGKNKDFKLAKDAELIFYNLDSIKDETECIICEGEIDALSFYEAGFYNVVSVPNGAGAGKINLEYLDNCWSYFENKKKIILAVDGDNAGYGLREELARRLGKDKCLKINYPGELIVQDNKTKELRPCKDANEVLIHFGISELKKMIANASEWPIEGVLSVGEDLIDDIYNFWENGFPSGIKTGIYGLDDLLLLQGGQFTTVTGIPGSGKSEFIDFIVAQTIQMQAWGWGICSFENQPSSIHATKLMQKIAKRAFAFRKNKEDRMSQMEFEKSLLMAHDYITFINVRESDISLEGILAKFKELVKRKGKRGFVIDPWNYIESSRPANITETEHVSLCLTKIKSFCIETDAHVFLVAHPTKLKKEANGKYEVPTMYSISGSAHFYNKTDNGIAVYRDFQTGLITVYIQKVRFEWNGKVGFCEFNFNDQTRQYIPLGSNVNTGQKQIEQIPQNTIF